MFDVTWVERNTARSDWNRIWQIIRKSEQDAIREDRSTIGCRQKFIDHVYACAVDGMVSLNESGMDCDCVRGESSRLVPAIPTLIEARIDRIYNDAEGPQSVWVDTPANAIESSWRDLAMEAYENGHPYSIHT